MMMVPSSLYRLNPLFQKPVDTTDNPTIHFGALSHPGTLLVPLDPPTPIPKIWQTNPSLSKLVGHIFRNVKFKLPGGTHTSGLTTLERAGKGGFLKSGKPLSVINVDSHSDLYFAYRGDQKVGIGNWLNKAILDYPQIKEVYWIMPREIRKPLL